MHDMVTPPMTVNVRRSVGVRTAARLVGVHESTVRRALQSGELEGYRAGRRGMYRIPPEAIAAWIRPAHDPGEATP
jgi:excisionase family DNA binding protein